MSANGETSAVMKGIKHGACDYLLKPVRMEELRNIWQHVVRKKWRNTGPSCMNEDDRVKQVSDDGDYTSSANEGPDVSWKQSKKRKDVKEEDEDIITPKLSSNNTHACERRKRCGVHLHTIIYIYIYMYSMCDRYTT